jgi:hypothetical protein
MSNTKTKNVTGFGRYAFADSITVKGNFTSFSVDNKELVRNCNFNFCSDNVTSSNLDGMFDGCINAVFSSRLSIPSGSSIVSASRAFKNCVVAKLPVVDIGESDIESCDRMFENCYAAELCGVQIPKDATMFEGMFRNAKSAFFNDISSIPKGNGDYHELFSGCENGVFQNLSFEDGFEGDLDCGFMFYYCGSMDCGNLGFDRVSRMVTDAGYMFYSAGSNGSKTFDDGIYDFSSLTGCECAFTNSNFSFTNSYFRFDGNGDINGNMMSRCTIDSISRMFSGCMYCSDTSPVVILGNLPGGFELSSIDSQLDSRLNGHYNISLKNCILDFSSLYEGSNFKTLDLRGIANNGFLAAEKKGGVQDFTSMCKDCRSLERIVGYLPSCASTYDSMFSGCTSLTAELPSLFKTQPHGWGNMSELTDSYNRDQSFESYSMTSIRGMFKDCAHVYSKKDTFDMVGLFKTVERNLEQSGFAPSEHIFESIRDSLPPTRIATKNPIPGLGNVRYVMDGLSENTGVIRYNSFADDPMETERDSSMSLPVSYGLHSDYAKAAFGRGFYRYGGEFLGDGGKCFFILFRPEKDDITGRNVGFTSDYTEYHVDLRPHGWGELFNTDRSKGYWSEFSYDKLYPGMVCSSDGTFIKFAYVGSYTRTYHEYRGNKDIGIYEYVTNYSMPVTYFDGYEESIKPL